MAILLRAAADMRWLMRPLRESAIPYVLEGSRRFYSRQEVILATALINAMACPHDPVPVLAILRSAFSGAKDSEILEFLEQENSLDYRGLGADVPAGPVQRCLSFLRDLHREVHGLAIDEVLTRILELDHLRLMEGSGFEGAQRLANLERLLQRLLREELIDLQDAATFLARNTRLSTEDEESDLFGSGVEAVRVLTVHKAKGLEFGCRFCIFQKAEGVTAKTFSEVFQYPGIIGVLFEESFEDFQVSRDSLFGKFRIPFLMHGQNLALDKGQCGLKCHMAGRTPDQQQTYK